MSSIDVAEFAHAGEKANQTIVLFKGTTAFEKLSFSTEPYLRKLGVNT